MAGLNAHCYNVGYDHGSMSTDPDPVGEGISSAPCTTTIDANKSYAKGYTDGMKASGVNSGDGYSQTTTLKNESSADIAKAYGGTVMMSNGDKYHGGKLVSFKASNGTRYRVRGRMDNR